MMKLFISFLCQEIEPIQQRNTLIKEFVSQLSLAQISICLDQVKNQFDKYRNICSMLVLSLRINMIPIVKANIKAS